MSVLRYIDRKRNSDLTVEEVKACSMFKHLTDEQAEEVVQTLKRFSEIIFHYYLLEKHSANNKCVLKK